MRAIFIKQATDWQALSATLVKSGADAAPVLARLQRLNPHVDFTNIGHGAVILVPDQPDTKAESSGSIHGDAFAALQEQLNDAVAATAADVRSGHNDRLTAQKDVVATLKSATVKRIIDNDPDLAKQAAAALDAVKQDSVRAKEADTALQSLQSQATSELSALARLLDATSDKPNPAASRVRKPGQTAGS